MIPQERIARAARAARATAAWDEFMAPMIDELRSAYAERMVLVANDELSSAKRADKITALSHATKILSTLESGMLAIIRDGEMAAKDKVRAENIERMTQSQRRLLGIVPV